MDLIFTSRKYCFKHTSTFETALIDHHHLIYLMLKTTFKNEESIQLIYHHYKNFDNANFQMDLESKFENFEKTFENALNAHAAKKTKFLHGNLKSYVNKNLCKAIMKHSQLKNEANRRKQLQDITKYKKQQNLVVKLNRESKNQYFDNIQSSKNFSKSVFGISERPIFQVNMLSVTLK